MSQQFISRASDEIQSLFSLHVGTLDEFTDVLQYFGETARDTTSAEWFTDLALFVNKFEVHTCLVSLIKLLNNYNNNNNNLSLIHI